MIKDFLSRLKRKHYVIAFIILIVCFGLYKNTSENYELLKYGEITKGKIVDYRFVRQTQYSVEYSYEVNGEKYTGSVITSLFGCEGKSDGCQGKTFKVIYSKRKPRVSDIDLGKYNEHKEIRPHF